MTYDRLAATADGTVVRGNYNSNGDWVGQGPDPRMFRYWMNIKRTSVISELVALAATRTNVNVEYRDQVGAFEDMDMADAAEAYDDGYNPEDRQKTHGSLWSADHKDKTEFWEELHRLEKLVVKPLDEPILTDDCLMYGGYWYTMDGKPRECEYFANEMNTGIRTVDYKSRYHIHEIRRCDMVGRNNRLPKQKERSAFDRNFKTQFRDGVTIAHSTQTQRRRKPRSSNKIKKVQ